MNWKDLEHNVGIQVLNENDQEINYLRGDDKPQQVWNRMLKQYGDRPGYVVQILDHRRNDKIIMDNQGSGNTVRVLSNKMKIANEQLKKSLETVTILDGEGSVTINSGSDWNKTVYVAIVHEGGSYWPAGVIYISDSGSEDGAFQSAFEILEESDKFRPNIEEWQKELYDEMLEEGMTEDEAMEQAYTQARENHDGMVFSVTAKEAYDIISKDKDAMKFVDFYLSHGTEGNEAIFANEAEDIIGNVLDKFFPNKWETTKTKNSASGDVYHSSINDDDYTQVYVHINPDDSATVNVENEGRKISTTEYLEFNDMDDFIEELPKMLTDMLRKID